MNDDVKARAREALTDPDNLDLALNPEPLVRDLLSALDELPVVTSQRDQLYTDLATTEGQRDEARNIIRHVEKLRDRYLESAAGANGDAMLRLTLLLTANEIDRALGGDPVGGPQC